MRKSYYDHNEITRLNGDCLEILTESKRYLFRKKILFSCAKCARCCGDISILERISISFHTKKLMLSRKCNFLSNENRCSLYDHRPELCKKWECGVIYES